MDTLYIIDRPIPMFEHLLESSLRDDPNKWSNIGFGEEIGILGFKIRSLSGALLLLAYFCIFLSRAPDKVHIFISLMPISSPSTMFDHLLESSHRYDSNKWSNIGYGEEITQVNTIEVNLMHLNLGSVSVSSASLHTDALM